ncbi:MAG: heme ABC exporter ATP-binding protein CcmA [Pseudomonadota bacterium]
MASMQQFQLSLHLRDLDIHRGGQVVAENVSFDVLPGEALVLRGPNGSGKTSILRAIAGFSSSRKGNIEFQQGEAIADPSEVRAHAIHWIGGGDGLADRLTVNQCVAFWAGLYGARPSPNLLVQVGLASGSDQFAGELSLGQRRRLAMTRLFLARRALWLLDEPLGGLDHSAKALMLKLIAAHRQEGGLVLMASHEEGLPQAKTLHLSNEVQI